MSGSGRIHAESVEAKFNQSVNQSAVTTPNVKDARACGKRTRDGRVELLPPLRAGHRPEPYPEAAPASRPVAAPHLEPCDTRNRRQRAQTASIRRPRRHQPGASELAIRAPHQAPPPSSAPHESHPFPPGPSRYRVVYAHARLAWQQAVTRAGTKAVAAMADAGHLPSSRAGPDSCQ